MAVTKPSTGRGIVPGFDFPAKANTIQLLVLWSDGKIAAWSSSLRLVELITCGPRDLEPHVVKSPLTTLSKKGVAVSAVSPMWVVARTASLACRRIFQANDLQLGPLNGPARVIRLATPWKVLAA